MYEGRNDYVSSLFYPGTKLWDVRRVRQLFSVADANAILATCVPQRSVNDRIAWTRSCDGFYSVKSGYQLWHYQFVGNANVIQSKGWSRIWRLQVPHKVKIFIWRFCRNNVPVRNRLKSKAVSVPILCPMCNSDVEHLLHIFFDCPFASNCWQVVGSQYDMLVVDSAPSWLLNKMESASLDEMHKVCTVLWGIWFWRNKRVWEEKVVTPNIAMENSFKSVQD